ncbi:MAG: UDP-N-acetylmuramoyl-L-alanine--D-glutamate ligase [Myxococcota bacterium]|nr:UDP-N-acetylmuramoyl-L-alanine--D-glutamate ligase [Myxococcota bacterium]
MTEEKIIGEGDRVLVLGLGITGRSAAQFCVANGARVVAADERPRDRLAGLEDLPPEVEIVTGLDFPKGRDFDLVIPSPGIPSERYRDDHARILGDVEIAARSLSVPVIAVTGTNGKTTTVALVEALLRQAGLRAIAAGNLGRPALSLVGEPLDVAVLEVSSFQLETTEQFAPRVSVVLNLTPDHLDRHGDFARYAGAKQRLVEKQGPRDTAVLNARDPRVAAFADHTAAEVHWFDGGPGRIDFESGAHLDAGSLVLRDRGLRRRYSLDDLGTTSPHSLRNAAAALAAVAALGVDPDKASPALGAFAGLPHRCETVAQRAGVEWINDSKATNVGAAMHALESLPGPVLWIAGGRDKALDFAPLANAVRGRVRKAFLIGECAAAIEAGLEGAVPTLRCTNLSEAVQRADAESTPGDTVLLSPACASFDQFESYEDRGDQFREAVAALDHGGETR